MRMRTAARVQRFLFEQVFPSRHRLRARLAKNCFGGGSRQGTRPPQPPRGRDGGSRRQL